MYFLVTNRIKENVALEKIKPIINAHIQWTIAQIKKGTIKQAGKWGEAGGMAIIEASNLSEAREIIDQDPLTCSELAQYELDRFYPDVKL